MFRILIFILLLCLFSFVVFGQKSNIQNLREEYDKQYGLDVLLHNGKKDNLYYKKYGSHPFLFSEHAFEADLVLSGERFNNKRVKYNLEKQEFLLLFENYKGASLQIVLIPEVIDSIISNNAVFVKSPSAKIKYQFVQVIYSGDIQCYIAWHKYLIFKGKEAGPSGYAYLRERKHLFIVNDNIVFRIDKKKDLLKAFDREYKADIRKYIVKNGPKFKKMSNPQLKGLIIHCEQLLK